MRITDEMGNVLLDYGDTTVIQESESEILDVDSYWMISGREKEESGWPLQIGIPKKVISGQMKVLYRCIYGYVSFGFLLVVALAYIFSRKEYLELKNFYSLIPEDEREAQIEKNQNEYDILMKIFRHLAENSQRYLRAKQELDRQNQAIRLERLIVDGINTQEERQELKQAEVIVTEFYCVVIARMSLKDQQQYSMALLGLKEYLQDNWKDKIFHIHTGIYDELFVFSMSGDSAPNVNEVQRLFENVSSILSDEMGITLGAGISTVGTDVSNLKRCYTQAFYVLEAYYQEEKNTVNHYRIDLDNARDGIVDLDFLNQLHRYIVHLNEEEVQKQFLLVKAYSHKYPVQFEAQKEQCFFAIRNILYNAMLYFGENPDENGMLPAYERERTVDVCIEKLQGAALWLVG